MNVGKYNVRWICPHCGHSHSWWWDQKWEAHSTVQTAMHCENCDAKVKCKGDGFGLYVPIVVGPRSLETRVSDLEVLEERLHERLLRVEDALSRVEHSGSSLLTGTRERRTRDL